MTITPPSHPELSVPPPGEAPPPPPEPESGLLARHLLCEYYGCPPEALDDPDLVARLLGEAAAAAKTTLLETRLHRFAPQGVSGVAILAESHLAIHTWPEHGFATVEVFVCGDEADPWAAHRHLLEAFGSAHAVTRLVPRGSLELARRIQRSPSEPAR